jgi:hypothetical protein
MLSAHLYLLASLAADWMEARFFGVASDQTLDDIFPTFQREMRLIIVLQEHWRPHLLYFEMIPIAMPSPPKGNR